MGNSALSLCWPCSTAVPECCRRAGMHMLPACPCCACSEVVAAGLRFKVCAIKMMWRPQARRAPPGPHDKLMYEQHRLNTPPSCLHMFGKWPLKQLGTGVRRPPAGPQRGRGAAHPRRWRQRAPRDAGGGPQGGDLAHGRPGNCAQPGRCQQSACAGAAGCAAGPAPLLEATTNSYYLS